MRIYIYIYKYIIYTYANILRFCSQLVSYWVIQRIMQNPTSKMIGELIDTKNSKNTSSLKCDTACTINESRSAYSRSKIYSSVKCTEKNVFTTFWLILNQTEVCLMPNQLENDKCNLIPVWFNKISKRFFHAYDPCKWLL